MDQQRVTNEVTGESLLVNGWSGLSCTTTVEEAQARLKAPDSFTKVESRRRLNDFVGSPIWSEWVEQ